MDYMSIDNKPSNEPRVMGEFKSFTQDRLEDLWTRIIGSERNIIKEKHVKIGKELPVVEIESMADVGVIFNAGTDSSLISWKDKNGETKTLPINPGCSVGFERAKTGEEAVVIMKTKGDKQTIRKFYKGE